MKKLKTEAQQKAAVHRCWMIDESLYDSNMCPDKRKHTLTSLQSTHTETQTKNVHVFSRIRTHRTAFAPATSNIHCTGLQEAVECLSFCISHLKTAVYFIYRIKEKAFKQNIYHVTPLKSHSGVLQVDCFML